MVYSLLIKMFLLFTFNSWAAENTNLQLISCMPYSANFKENNLDSYRQDSYLSNIAEKASNNETKMLKIFQEFDHIPFSSENENSKSPLYEKWEFFITDLSNLLCARNNNFCKRKRYLDLSWTKTFAFRGFVMVNPFDNLQVLSENFTLQENLIFLEKSQNLLKIFEEFCNDKTFFERLEKQKKRKEIDFLKFFFDNNVFIRRIDYLNQIYNDFFIEGKRFKMPLHFQENIDKFSRIRIELARFSGQLSPHLYNSSRKIDQLRSPQEIEKFYMETELDFKKRYGFKIFYEVERYCEQAIFLISTLEEYLKNRYNQLKILYQKFISGYNCMFLMREQFIDHCYYLNQFLIQHSSARTDPSECMSILSAQNDFHNFSYGLNIFSQINSIIPQGVLTEDEPQNYSEQKINFLDYQSESVLRQIQAVSTECTNKYHENFQKLNPIFILEKKLKTLIANT